MRCLPDVPGGLLTACFLTLLSDFNCCTAETNKFDWTYKLPVDSFSSPALLSDGSVVVGCGQGSQSSGGLFSVSRSGQLNWQLPIGPVMASPLVTPDDTIYVGSTLGSFYSISPAGSLNWTFKTTNSTPQATRGKLHSSAALGPFGTVYVTAVGQGLCALNPDGTLKWMFPLPALTQFAMQISSPAIGPDGTIYLGSVDKNVYAIWPNGALRWRQSTGNSISASPCITEDGTVLIGSDDGKLYAFSAQGSKKWEFDTGRIIESSCALGPDGTIYVGSLNNRFFALSPTGQPKWTNLTSSPISGSPLVTSDGQIWVGSLTGSLHVYGADGTEVGVNRFGGNLFSSPTISPGSDPCFYFTCWNTLYSRGVTSNLALTAWPMFRRDPRHQARADQCGLAVTGKNNAALQLTLLVETHRLYQLESSDDLIAWKTLQELSSTTPEVHLAMPWGNRSAFYRLRTDQGSP